MRQISKIMAAVAVAGIALAGCGSQSQETLKVKLSDLNIQPRNAIQDGGKLRLPIGTLPANWNALNVDGNDQYTKNILNWISPYNFGTSADASEMPEDKDYVLSYKVDDAKDGKPQVVTLELNPKAKWNDGTPITYEDYRSNWKACNGENAEFNCGSTDGFDQVTSIDKGKDEFEVKITFKNAYPDWKAVFSSVINKKVTDDPKTFNEGQAGNDAHPEWFTGPYMIKSVEDGADKIVTLVPNKNWWGNKPKLDEITFRVFANTEAEVSAYTNKEIDVVDSLISADDYKKASARSTSDGQIRFSASTSWRHFTINAKAGIFKDKAVRQALTYGLNREAIAKVLLAGLPIVPKDVVDGNHFFMPGQKGYQNNAPAYDLEKAKKTLEDAGWKPGPDGIRVKDGQPLSAEFLGLNLFASSNEGQVLQQQAKQFGMDIKLKIVPSKEFFKTIMSGNYQITSFTWVGTPFPLNNIGQIYGCPTVTDGKEAWGSNFSFLCNENVMKLRNQISINMNEDERVKQGNEADKLIWEDVFNIPLYARYNFTAVPKNLANYGAAMFETTLPEDIGYMKESK